LRERLLQSAELLDSQHRLLSLIDAIQKILQSTAVSASELEHFVCQIVSQRDEVEQDLSKVRLKQQEMSSQISDVDAALLNSHESAEQQLVAAQASRDGIKKRIEELEAQLALARGDLAASENHLASVRLAAEASKKQFLHQQGTLQKEFNVLVADASQDERELRGIQTIETLLKSFSLETSAAHNRIIAEMQQTHSRCSDDHFSAMTMHCRHLISSTSVMRRQVQFLNSEIADLDAKATKLQELGMTKELKGIPSHKQARRAEHCVVV
jgi:chromosome segregation ATPase